MFNRERRVNSQSELEASRERYHQALRIMVAGHDQAALGIAEDHADTIAKIAASWSSLQDHDQALQVPAELLRSVFNRDEHTLVDILNTGHRTLSDGIPAIDQEVWRNTRVVAVNQGVNSPAVSNALRCVSNKRVKHAIRGALDAQVWREVRKEALEFGVTNSRVNKALDGASSREARRAMRAALDGYVWNEIWEKANEVSFVSYSSVEATLSQASSEAVQAAMRAALDDYVWQLVSENALTFGPNSNAVRTALKCASSQQAEDVMWESLHPIRPQGNLYESILNGSFDALFENLFRTMGDQRLFEDQRAQGFDGFNFVYEDPAQQKRSQADQEAEDIIQQAITKDLDARLARGASPNGGVGWLERAERSDVKRVIRTVRTIRRQASDNGESITDRQIYVRYRRYIETGNPSPQLEKSFKILAALMGDDPKGQLPF